VIGVVACSSSTSSPATTSGADGGDASVAEASTTDAATTDSAATDSATPSGKGLTIAKATVAMLDGTYDIPVTRVPGTNGIAFNGSIVGQLEFELDTDAAGVVKAAHVWNYKGGATSTTPDKFYGCDGGKTLACSTVAVDLTTNVITIGVTTWPEVQPIMFDGSPDMPVAGGATVTVSGTLQATL
jgi:hypothetical protein